MLSESEAYARWERVADLEEKFYKQRSKIHWLAIGDRNNKTFYQGIKTREAQNTIREIHGAKSIKTLRTLKRKPHATLKTFYHLLHPILMEYQLMRLKDFWLGKRMV